jgi:hypothetical protein
MVVHASYIYNKYVSQLKKQADSYLHFGGKKFRVFKKCAKSRKKLGRKKN